MNNRITAEELLNPIVCTCGKCGGELTIYPDEQQGKGYCVNCSPAWLKSFAIFSMNQLRIKHGLKEL